MFPGTASSQSNSSLAETRKSTEISSSGSVARSSIVSPCESQSSSGVLSGSYKCQSSTRTELSTKSFICGRTGRAIETKVSICHQIMSASDKLKGEGPENTCTRSLVLFLKKSSIVWAGTEVTNSAGAHHQSVVQFFFCAWLLARNFWHSHTQKNCALFHQHHEQQQRVQLHCRRGRG